jgi:Flp pilus assembly protein TadG
VRASLSSRRRSRLSKDQEGAAAVEFALVATVLLLLVFGIIEFGMWLSQYEAMASAAREGARIAAVRGDATQVADAICKSAQPYSKGDVSPCAGIAPGPIGISVAGGGTQCSDTTIGRQVTVSWTQNFSALNLLTILPILPDQRVIQGTFRCE